MGWREDQEVVGWELELSVKLMREFFGYASPKNLLSRQSTVIHESYAFQY